MTEHTSMVTIRDVMPRDGLQAETPLPAAIRANLAIALADAGLTHVEAASFVSPKAVPSMAGFRQVTPCGGRWFPTHTGRVQRWTRRSRTSQ